MTIEKLLKILIECKEEALASYIKEADTFVTDYSKGINLGLRLSKQAEIETLKFIQNELRNGSTL